MNGEWEAHAGSASLHGNSAQRFSTLDKWKGNAKFEVEVYPDVYAKHAYDCWQSYNLLNLLVGASGIEPPTTTVSR